MEVLIPAICGFLDLLLVLEAAIRVFMCAGTLTVEVIYHPGIETVSGKFFMLTINAPSACHVVYDVVVLESGARETARMAVSWGRAPEQLTYLEDPVVSASRINRRCVVVGFVTCDAYPGGDFLLRYVVFVSELARELASVVHFAEHTAR